MTTADLAPTTQDEPALLDWLRTMREQHPIWQDGYGIWHVFRHADVDAITRDTATFSSDTARLHAPPRPRPARPRGRARPTRHADPNRPPGAPRPAPRGQPRVHPAHSRQPR